MDLSRTKYDRSPAGRAASEGWSARPTNAQRPSAAAPVARAAGLNETATDWPAVAPRQVPRARAGGWSPAAPAPRDACHAFGASCAPEACAACGAADPRRAPARPEHHLQPSAAFAVQPEAFEETTEVGPGTRWGADAPRPQATRPCSVCAARAEVPAAEFADAAPLPPHVDIDGAFDVSANRWTRAAVDAPALSLDAPGGRARSGEPAAASPERRPRRGLRLLLVALLAALGIGASTLGYLNSQQYEETDDAQIDGHVSSVSSRVVGTVRNVYVKEHQDVPAGALLAELEAVDFDLAVSVAKANLARAKAGLQSENPAVPMVETTNAAALAQARAELASAQAAAEASLRDQRQLDAQLVQARAQASLASTERARASGLLQSGAVARSDFDARARSEESAAANVEAVAQMSAAASARRGQRMAAVVAAQARLDELLRNSPRQLAVRQGALAAAQAGVELAQSQLEQAEQQLAYTKIYAPIAGQVGSKMVSVGDHVGPGQRLFSICPTDDIWVTANFRETQLRDMRPGQRANIYVDALDAHFHGTVESTAGATGSRFSLLPPENASGNYVKVVQRIPVRIRLDPGQPELSRLRAGMSVEPAVKVR